MISGVARTLTEVEGRYEPRCERAETHAVALWALQNNLAIIPAVTLTRWELQMGVRPKKPTSTVAITSLDGLRNRLACCCAMYIINND